jgi:hypothetical protein
MSLLKDLLFMSRERQARVKVRCVFLMGLFIGVGIAGILHPGNIALDILSSFLLVTGIQILLWVVGAQLELFGTASESDYGLMTMPPPAEKVSEETLVDVRDLLEQMDYRLRDKPPQDARERGLVLSETTALILQRVFEEETHRRVHVRAPIDEEYVEQQPDERKRQEQQDQEERRT